jgi:hypothetical protein
MLYALRYVMVSCNTVANNTHKRYGTCRYATHFAYGQIAHIIQGIVIRTIRITRDANGRLFKPNWTGVKTALAIRFMTNGSATNFGTWPWKTLTNTYPKLIAISMYSTDHTGPNSHEGGANHGCMYSA